MANENKNLAIISILGVGGVLAWYLLKKEGPIVEKKEFIISKIDYPFEAQAGSQVTITVMGKNLQEEGDCYCKIINNKTSQVLLDQHEIVGSGEIKSFVLATNMPMDDDLSLRIETGKWIEGERERHSYQDISIKVRFVEFKASVIINKIY